MTLPIDEETYAKLEPTKYANWKRGGLYNMKTLFEAEYGLIVTNQDNHF